MIGLVLVTHGRLAAEFVTAMEHVVGPQEAIEAICNGPDDDMESRRGDIAKAIAKVHRGQGVIILTALFDVTPPNLDISLLKGAHVEEIDGVKLPFKLTQVMPNMKFVITLEDVKHNVPVDEAIFRRP